MNKSQGPYIAVDCGLHSEYELAIMHHVMLQLVWLDQNGNKLQQKLIPVDLKTMDKSEYLVARSSEGEVQEIRLDKILHSNVREAINT